MCTEHITKHRLFPKDKTEFYKVLVEDKEGKYFSPYYQTEYIIGEKCFALIEQDQLATLAPDHYRIRHNGDKCDVAIHLFENREDAKVYARDRGFDHMFISCRPVLGIFQCDSDDFYCCGLTEDYLPNMYNPLRHTIWLPTACYNAATLVRVEELDKI